MKRPSATNLRNRENTDYIPDSTQDSNQEFLEEPSSPYLSNMNGLLSDSDCLSDASKKIRKKRNTYQKISDDIRVLLLEAVQNGETLKAAAKRHKINYSSAKSILHTYRKEGRILKKSAQERTIKRKTEIFSEVDATPQKPVKASKKENVQPTLASSKISHFAPLAAEKGKQQQQGQSNAESTPLACTQGFNDNSSTLKSVKHEYNAEDYTHGKMVTEGQTAAHPFHHKEDEHRDGTLEGTHNTTQKTKYFDNFHMSYFDAPLCETGVDHHQLQQQPNQAGEGHEYTNYMFPQGGFDPFGEMMNSMQHNNGAFLYPKGFNVVNPLEDKKGEHMMSYEDGGDLRGFMDAQNGFRQALRKASFFSYGGNSTGYRKDSMDLF